MHLVHLDELSYCTRTDLFPILQAQTLYDTYAFGAFGQAFLLYENRLLYDLSYCTKTDLYDNRLVSYSTRTDMVREQTLYELSYCTRTDFCTSFPIVREQTCTRTDWFPILREQTLYETYCTSTDYCISTAY